MSDDYKKTQKRANATGKPAGGTAKAKTRGAQALLDNDEGQRRDVQETNPDISTPPSVGQDGLQKRKKIAADEDSNKETISSADDSADTSSSSSSDDLEEKVIKLVAKNL